jgi:hypothetical protein
MAIRYPTGANVILDNTPLIRQAINEIYETYGDIVSVDAKRKSLNKFGRNNVVGTSFETLSEFQGATSNETFVTSNLIDSISSSNMSDTSITVTIFGEAEGYLAQIVG